MLGHPTRFFPGRLARAWLRFVVASLLLAAAASASLPRDVQFHTRTWTADDGLPHNSTSGVMQDARGFMWFSTAGGLARFDGRVFSELIPPAEHRSSGFNIRGVAEEKPGTLVVLPTGGSVLRLTGKVWSVHPVTASAADVFAHHAPHDLHVDAGGNVWAITAGGHLVRWQPDGVTRVFYRKDHLSPRPVRFSIASDASGDLWFAYGSQLSVYREGEMKEQTLMPPEPLLIGGRTGGPVWICTQGRLQRLDRGRLVTVLDDVPWRGEIAALRHILEDSTGRVWIASSRHGLFCYIDGRVQAVATPYLSVSHVAEDREGNIWVATEGGIGQLREKSYRRINQASGLLQEAVNSISEDPAGGVWLANRAGGLVHLTPEGLPKPVLPDKFANVVRADARHHIWFGGAGSRLFRYDPATNDPPVAMPAPLQGLHVLFEARNGDMWFAAHPEELGYYRDDQVRHLTRADGMTANNVSAIAQDSTGDLWIGGRDDGVLRWDGSRFHSFPDAPQFARQPVQAIAIDRADRLWIGTVGGLVLKEGPKFHHLTRQHGLAGDIIQGIVEDDFGRLWFAAPRGIFYVSKQELLAVAHGASGRLTSHLLGRDQGLVGVTPVATYSPTAVKTRDGRLWFATVQGAVVVEPARVQRDLPPPPVLIDEVRVDGETVEFAGGLRLRSGPHRLEFQIAALSHTTPESVKVSHQLEGADPHWVDTGSERIASYSNLPPGDYRLRVTAQNGLGGRNENGALLAITIVPMWWETLPFRVAAVALPVALTAFLARALARRRWQRRLRELEREHALEKERARIARDLHDDLGASLTEVGLLADRLVGAAPRDLAPQLSGLAWRTRRLATDLAGIVWTMSPSNATLDRLAAFLRRYAERVFRNTGIRCTVRGVDTIPPLPLAPDSQHQLLAATKEALNNILKHAQATEARIEMCQESSVFEVHISDDGAGFAFDPAADPDGNGLRNMRSRLEEIGGSCEVSSTPGRGTHIVLRFPCTPAKVSA